MIVILCESSSLFSEEGSEFVGILESELDLPDLSFFHVDLRHEVFSDVAGHCFEWSCDQTGIVDASPVSNGQ